MKYIKIYISKWFRLYALCLKTQHTTSSEPKVGFQPMTTWATITEQQLSFTHDNGNDCDFDYKLLQLCL